MGSLYPVPTGLKYPIIHNWVLHGISYLCSKWIASRFFFFIPLVVYIVFSVTVKPITETALHNDQHTKFKINNSRHEMRRNKCIDGVSRWASHPSPPRPEDRRIGGRAMGRANPGTTSIFDISYIGTWTNDASFTSTKGSVIFPQQEKSAVRTVLYIIRV